MDEACLLCFVGKHRPGHGESYWQSFTLCVPGMTIFPLEVRRIVTLLPVIPLGKSVVVKGPILAEASRHKEH